MKVDQKEISKIFGSTIVGTVRPGASNQELANAYVKAKHDPEPGPRPHGHEAIPADSEPLDLEDRLDAAYRAADGPLDEDND